MFGPDIPSFYHRELKGLHPIILDRSLSVIRELSSHFKVLGQPRSCYADDPTPDQGFHMVWLNFTIHISEDPLNVYSFQFFPNIFRPDIYEIFSYSTPREVLQKAAEKST